MQHITVVHCETEEQTKELLAWADNLELKWNNGDKYKNRIDWNDYGKDTCYNLNGGTYLSIEYAKNKRYNILEFKDIIDDNVIEDDNLVSMDKKYKTRDGRNARIICTDMKDENYPVIALIESNDGTEDVFTLTKEGAFTMKESNENTTSSK